MHTLLVGNDQRHMPHQAPHHLDGSAKITPILALSNNLGLAEPSIHILGVLGVLIGVSMLAGLCRSQTFAMSHFDPL